MLHYHQAPPQEVDDTDHHATDCTNCAASLPSKNETAPAYAVVPSSRSAASVVAEAQAEEGACLRPDCLGMFVLNELKEQERQQVEKHCALCEPCREQLVEVFCALTLPVDVNEQAYCADSFLLCMDTQQNFPCVV